MNQFQTNASDPSTSSGFSRIKTHDSATSSRLSRMIDAQIQQQLPQPIRIEDRNIRIQNLHIDDSFQYRSRYVQKVSPYGGETSMNIKEIGNNKIVPMITDSYLQRVVRRRDERIPCSNDSGIFERDAQSGRNRFPELNNSRNPSRDFQEKIMYSFSDNETFLTQRNVAERKSLTSDYKESLIYRELQERKQKIDESNSKNFQKEFEETNAMNRGLDFSGKDLLRPSNAYKSNFETPDSNVLDIRRRNERVTGLNESYSSSRFHGSNNADIHKDIWYRNNRGGYSGKSDFMSNYHDMNNMEVSDDSELHSTSSHSMASLSVSPSLSNLTESYPESTHGSMQHSNPRNISKIFVKAPETLNNFEQSKFETFNNFETLIKTEDCDDMNPDAVDTAVPVELYNEKLFHNIILVLMNLLGEKNMRQYGYPHTCVDTILQKTLLRIRVQPCTKASLKDVFDRTLLNFRYLLEYCVDENMWDSMGWKDKNVEDIIEEFMIQIKVER